MITPEELPCRSEPGAPPESASALKGPSWRLASAWGWDLRADGVLARALLDSYGGSSASESARRLVPCELLPESDL